MPDVVVVGAGPVGLVLGSELRRRGVDVALLERRPEPGAGSRAIGVHAPVLGALEESGITERLLAGAVRVRRGEARAGGELLGTVRFDRLRVRFPFVATLPQAATEAALAVDAPGPHRGTAVHAVRPDGGRLRILAHGAGGEAELGARIVVVATGSGGRDLAFRAGGLHIRSYPDRYLMTDAEAADDDATAVVRLGEPGVLESFPLPGGRRRYVAWDPRPDDDTAEGRAERLRWALRAHGEAEAADRLTDATGFRVRRAVAPRMRRGGLVVVGDAAHEVSPIGGQGMNLGLLDAVLLAPLLADWIRTGTPPESDLARWERRRVGSARRAAALAAANTRLGRPLGPRADAVRQIVLRAALARPVGAVFAHAYAMGLDRGA